MTTSTGRRLKGSAQQLGSVFLDLDEVAKIAGVVKGAGLPLSTIAALPDAMN
jgi:hypothetical protein